VTFAAREAFSAAVGPGPGFAPVTHLYQTPGIYTETAPSGATSLTLQVGGPGGGGGVGGGGSGGWCEQTIPVGSVGLSFTVVVMAGGAPGQTGAASSVVGAGLNLIAGGGGGDANGSGGAGGVASAGGGIVVSGNQGSPTAGGAPVIGIISSGAGGAPGAAGQAGAAAFAYS
jgi:hypothetical protein